MNNKFLFLIITAFLFNSCNNSKSRIREINKTFSTYGFSDPDKVPKPDRNYYPYFRFDGYEKEPVQKDWKIVEMENQYVKVHIVPDIGGKIWGAIEKSTGNKFLYYNSVVKFRNIGMRGPWTSGGIEFNFGIIGHSPHVSTPVDYFTRENDDGSVSCFIGGIDLITRAKWETEINLHPDYAYFTTKTKYSNPTSMLQPYYQWSNAAYQAGGGLRMSFPGNYRIGHGGEADPWPISDDGTDLTKYENNAYGGDKSYHIVGAADGYFAAYYDDINFGAGHFANYGDKLGKKIWLWSHARSGRIWEDLLTDEDGQYVELQSGRLFNQASTRSTQTPYKHFGFVPYATDDFEEYWYPIMNIGGVVKANNIGALNVVSEEAGSSIYFSPLQPFDDEIFVYVGKELKHSFKASLKPLEVWHQSVDLKQTDAIEIIVGANQGLVYTEEINHTNRPVKAPDAFKWNSIYGQYIEGINWIYQGNFERALTSLENCLVQDPYYVPALNHLAELYIRKGDVNYATRLVSRSLSINTYDPKANFIYGLVNRLNGIFVDSRDGFAVASVSPEYRTSATLESAKLYMLENQWDKAYEFAKRVLDGESKNQEALQVLAVISRKLNRLNEAGDYLDCLENISPLNHFIRSERLFFKENNQNRENLSRYIRNELPHQTFIELALWYQYVGCYNEAISILKISPENAMVDLLLSYQYKDFDVEQSMKYFNDFIDKSPDFVFPFRHEIFPVLKWAIQLSDHWKPKYYLGLLHWSKGNKVLAKELFISLNDIPQYPYFFLARNELLSEDETYNVEKDLFKALELGSADWRTSLAVIDYFLSKDMTSKALEASTKSLQLFPENDALKYTYAKCLLANGMYSESLTELENTIILPHEGARHGRVTYRQAAVMESLQYYKNKEFKKALGSISKARMWPENLGVGQPFEVDERIEDFLEAEILLQLNDTSKADALYQNIVKFKNSRGRRFNSTDYLHVVALRRLGEFEKVDEFLKQWEQRSPEDPALDWIQSMIKNNGSDSIQIEKKINTGSEGSPWDPRYSDPEFELVKAIANDFSI